MESGPSAPKSPPRVSTGVEGLDEVLRGGLTANAFHLVTGAPGTGKTTLGLQFLREGERRGEKVVYVALAETRDEIAAVGLSHGWNLDGIEIYEMAPTEEGLRPDEQYTVFHPAEVELADATDSMLREIERVNPARIVFDSLTELRLLAHDSLRYRRQMLALKRFFAGRNTTVLLLDDESVRDPGLHLLTISHGIIRLEDMTGAYGGERRRLRVMKIRGVRFRAGYHDFRIETGGLRVFPRLPSDEPEATVDAGTIVSGVPELERLLGGGLDRGTSALFMGPSGTGKSALAAQYACAAAGRSELVVFYFFDESRHTLMTRSAGLGLPLRDYVERGRIVLRAVSPSDLSPGEFAQDVRRFVEEAGARMVVIDSLNGYLNAMSEERMIFVHLHELLSYVARRGVVTLLTVAQHGLVGPGVDAPIDVSYLADTVLLFRYFEATGRVRQAISVVKKRSGSHERTIRELTLGAGIRIGPPLEDFQGILSGTPTFCGRAQLLEGNGE